MRLFFVAAALVELAGAALGESEVVVKDFRWTDVSGAVLASVPKFEYQLDFHFTFRTCTRAPHLSKLLPQVLHLPAV